MATASVDPVVEPHSDSDAKRKSCVRCSALQPLDGKFLSCLHVMCAGCLRDSCCGSADSSSVKCTLCSELTSGSAALCGVELEHQLTDCQPLLYAGQRQTPSSDGADNGQVLCDACKYNDDDIAPRPATFQCVSCDGEALFCQQHAEKHGKTRRYTGHTVRSLADRASNSSSNNPLTGQHGSVHTRRRSCAVHRHCDVITYCETCQEAVCQQCLAGEHDSHTVISLKTVAQKQRGKLQEQTAQFGTGHSTADPISLLLTEVAKELEAVEEEAAAASTVVTDTFSRVRLLLKESEDHALQKVDMLLWKVLEPLQLRQQRLHSIQAQHITANDLAKILSSADSEDSEVVSLGKLVSRGLAQLGLVLEKEQTSVNRDRITAVVESLDTMEKRVQSLVHVGGEKIIYGGSTIPLQLDPARCSSHITLCDDGRIASHSGSGNQLGTVVTTKGFTHGVHQWSAKLHRVAGQYYWMRIGVTALPLSGRFNGTALFFDNDRCYGWSAGGSVRHTSGSGENRSKLQNGDVVTLRLDLEQKTLELHVHRTGERRHITGLQCDEPLYPAFCFAAGQQAEILDGNMAS